MGYNKPVMRLTISKAECRGPTRYLSMGPPVETCVVELSDAVVAFKITVPYRSVDTVYLKFRYRVIQ